MASTDLDLRGPEVITVARSARSLEPVFPTGKGDTKAPTSKDRLRDQIPGSSKPRRQNRLMPQTEEVFISYAHDTPENAQKVLELSNRLRSEGVDCVLDQYEEAPPEGWPRWMDKKIRDAKFVLMICTDRKSVV